MLTIHSSTPPRPAVLNPAVLANFASYNAEPSWLSSVQKFLQLACVLAEEEISQLAVAPMQLPIPAEDVLLTVEQAASTLDVSRQTIHNWVRKDYLTAYKLGCRTYFKKAELLDALRLKTRPDGFRKNARRTFAPKKSKIAVGGAGLC